MSISRPRPGRRPYYSQAERLAIIEEIRQRKIKLDTVRRVPDKVLAGSFQMAISFKEAVLEWNRMRDRCLLGLDHHSGRELQKRLNQVRAICDQVF